MNTTNSVPTTYGELGKRLAELRKECDIDFAHFTYNRGQCSCCYGPKDLPSKYWKNHTIAKGNDYTYILYKNAYNGGGIVKGNDTIKNTDYISWNLRDDEQLNKVVAGLREIYGEDYTVSLPESRSTCIIVKRIC